MPLDPQPAALVIDNPTERRYELRRDDEVLGVAVYRLQGNVINLLHTEIDADHEGEGLGSAIAAGVLDDVRSRGLLVQPTCPFIAGWIEKHPDYQDLVA
jgi:predicted GNAT family acetyltransferase